MIRLVVLAAIALACASPAHARHRVPRCGLYMTQLKRKTDSRLARAIEWAKEGIDAFGPR